MFDRSKSPETEVSLPPRQMLLLDLDENLVSVKLSPDDRSTLSASAEAHLDKTSITKVSLFGPKPSADDADVISNEPDNQIHAICKPEWTAVFEKIIAVNHRYRELNPADKLPLIDVKILTLASYDRRKFMEDVFSKFYGEIITNQLFKSSEFYFYNYASQVMTKTVNNKGKCMSIFFDYWKYNFPGLTKDRVYLVDDNLRNVDSARLHGFSAIHHPTNTKGRKPNTSYAQEKDGVFKQLHEIIAVAEKYCDQLEAKPAVRKESSSAIK